MFVLPRTSVFFLPPPRYRVTGLQLMKLKPLSSVVNVTDYFVSKIL